MIYVLIKIMAFCLKCIVHIRSKHFGCLFLFNNIDDSQVHTAENNDKDDAHDP